MWWKSADSRGHFEVMLKLALRLTKGGNMELEYWSGVRITNMYHELSPLEAANDWYEKMAKKHFQVINKKGALDDKQRKERKEALAFLAAERLKLDTKASVQGQLAEYRARGLDATKGSGTECLKAARLLWGEEHYPTGALEKYMHAEGQIKPSRLHTAHHIVPGKTNGEASRLVCIIDVGCLECFCELSPHTLYLFDRRSARDPPYLSVSFK